jgi:hypothetical protein
VESTPIQVSEKKNWTWPGLHANDQLAGSTDRSVGSQPESRPITDHVPRDRLRTAHPTTRRYRAEPGGELGACLLRWLWSARPRDKTLASRSSVATGHPILFGTLAQLSLYIFRLCLWRTAGSPTSGNQSSNRPLCAARSRAPQLRPWATLSNSP